MHRLEYLSLKELTQKLTTLLALTSAQRIQSDFIKIELQNIFEYKDRLKINISTKIETSGLNRKQSVLMFPFFKENPRLCTASLILFYINATKVFRGNNKSLIFTYQKPYHPASPQSLSRWIKGILSKSD
nr:unnamed protein product [Callosobruchus analis]